METLYSCDIQHGLNKNEQIINGSILRHQLGEAMEFYSFQFNCKQEFKVIFPGSVDTAIYVLVNLELKYELVLNCGENRIICPPFSSLLLPIKDSLKLSFIGVPNSPYDFLLVRLDREHLSEDQSSLIKWLEAETGFLNPKYYERSLAPSLAICDLSRKLQKIHELTFENKFMAWGYCNLLFGLKLKEFKDGDKTVSNALSGFEIKQLEMLSEQIRNEPEKQYTIKDICRQTGLSVSKLQFGFKKMHKTTVAIFIRNVRLEKAVEFLEQSNMNIAEVVYSIGLTSRSYFCRVFKKRYKCSPKNFQQLHRISKSS